MRIGCSTFVFEFYKETTWSPETMMHVIHDQAFEGVEYTNWQQALHEPQVRAQSARQTVQNAQLVYASTGLFVEVPETDPSLREAHEAQKASVAPVSGRAQIEYARLAGVEVLVTHAFPGPGQVKRQATHLDFQNLASSLLELVTYSAKWNIPLALHNHLNNLGQTTAEMERILSDVPGLKVCLDIAHLAAAGDDPVKFIYDHGDRLGIIHLKNLDPAWQSLQAEGKMIFSHLDEGCLDIGATVAALKQVGFTGWVIVELERPAGTPSEALRREREVLRKLGL